MMTKRNEPTEVKRAYSSDEALNKYEDLNELGFYDVEERLVKRYFQPRSARVLDVACGAGRTTKPLAKMGYDVVGIDISEEMISKANLLFPELDFRVGDAADLPFPDESFDFILFSYMNIDYLYPREQRLQSLRELNRVLKKGGRLIFGTGNSLHVIPALLRRKPSHLFRFYVRNENYKRIFRVYKKDPDEWNLRTYFGTQPRNLLDLHRYGFKTEHISGKRESMLRFFEEVQYYVARKIKHIGHHEGTNI
ncbi:class I SAM-dependent methyltransferase [Natronosalvus rutilus]|uniref:Class I SAM-dependent methyltransferase n=1 Tax=Natronosalvus rutilus TaxID=2953753 RepID=A0A9E7NFL1_9EURY|nr:class I SAM-dependent methyltransferase [Natronosalvus rutilus]UTF55923.1 class I SAM-dependent methyltransferase [Natronosalvus rutilus]